MPETCVVSIDGIPVRVNAGTTVAAAVLASGKTAFRRSVSGELRGPLCGMGVCFECRLTIDGLQHSRSCQILCREGMRIQSDE